MAEEKKNFIFYTSWKTWLDAMTLEQKGKWLDWVMTYCDDQEPSLPDDAVVKMGCLIAKENLKRDLVKYQERLERLHRNGKQYQKVETDKTDVEPISTQCRTDIDGVNVNVNDNVNVNVNVKEDNKLSINNTIKEHKSKPSVPKSALEKTFDEFISMRTKIKKPMTANAKERMLKKLDSICGTDEDLKIKVLEQSIDHCWQDIYPLKDENQTDYGSTSSTQVQPEIVEDVDLSFLEV